MAYAFVRREEPNYANMGAAGWNTPLFAADDPRLGYQIQQARAAGSQYGIWADPNWYQDKSPQAFAQQMAQLQQQYGPSVIVPDIEFIGKGYAGSPGWQYNQQLADALKQHLPGANIAMTVMGNQDDFNYGAYKGLVNQWLPQSYGADSSKDFNDPNAIVQTLIRNGVDPSLITPVLAGPQFGKGYNGPAALWTYDDNETGTLPHAGSGDRSGPPSPAGTRSPQSTSPRDTPQSAHLPDSANPRAVAYANMRLGQLVRAGVLRSMPKGDPTAAWRAASTGVNALAQQLGYSSGRDFLRTAGARVAAPTVHDHGSAQQAQAHPAPKAPPPPPARKAPPPGRAS